MIRSLEKLGEGAVINADVAVIGAGAAGITIALELAGTARDVLLVESGGMEFDPATQALYEGTNTGSPDVRMDVYRLRFFGGSTNHWGGHCRPLDPIDFERRSWVPNSGWPIGYEEVKRYYARAQELCELGPFRWEGEDWPELNAELIPFASDKIRNRAWQVSTPTVFGQAYLGDLEAARNVGILLNANLVDIRLDSGGRHVASVELKTLGGKAATLRPRALVLACGGIENARILLSCNAQQPAGLGNGYDLVGRYFMEHPHALAAYAVREAAPLKRFAAYYDTFEHQGTVIKFKPGISETLQERLGVLNGCLDVGYGYDRSEGYLALRHIGNALLEGKITDRFGAAALDVLGDLDGMAEGVYRRLRDEQVIWFATTFEQLPDPESRVTLSGERDALGMRRSVVHGRISNMEKQSVRAICKVIGEELARLGYARMRIDPWVLNEDAPWVDVDARAHHMGTTRMAASPRRGVVDGNCRVHGIDNLYVAGGSVFSTSGYANCTLTIVALAVRLANHLKNEGSQPAASVQTPQPASAPRNR